MDDAAPHIRDVATHAEDDTNRTDDPHHYVGDMEMVETTSTDDELQSAWREDRGDSTVEDTQSNVKTYTHRRLRQSNLVIRKWRDYRRTVRNVMIHKQRRAPIWLIEMFLLSCIAINTDNNNNNGRNGSCLTWLATSLEEQRRWLIINASPRGQCSK